MGNLEKKKWKDTYGVKWKSRERDPNFGVSDFRATESEEKGGIGWHNALKCLKCGGMQALPYCDNCGYPEYKAGWTSEGVQGIFCSECEIGFTRWECQKCGTYNPVHKTIQEDSGFCFIATASFGAEDFQELMLFRKLRDEVLEPTVLGRYFIKTYYHFSPPIAQIIAKSSRRRWVAKNILLKSILSIILRLKLIEGDTY
ncbi:MAG: CFI-box-CTERM domain-containing protein [bacterium]